MYSCLMLEGQQGKLNRSDVSDVVDLLDTQCVYEVTAVSFHAW